MSKLYKLLHLQTPKTHTLLHKKTLKREKGVEPDKTGEEAYRIENAKYSVLFHLEKVHFNVYMNLVSQGDLEPFYPGRRVYAIKNTTKHVFNIKVSNWHQIFLIKRSSHDVFFFIIELNVRYLGVVRM